MMPEPLWADAGLIKLIIIVLVIGFTIISKIMTKIQQVRQQAEAARPRNPEAGHIQGEVEEFLRRAGQARKEEAAAASAQADEEAPLLRPMSDVGGDRVDEEVRQHLDTSAFGRRSAKFGGEMAQADQDFDERSKQTFRHDVGRLGESGAQQPLEADEVEERAAAALAASDDATAGLFALFGRPETLREAILINEIFQRPVNRWED